MPASSRSPEEIVGELRERGLDGRGREIAEEAGVTLPKICSKSRHRGVCRARARFWTWIYEHRPLSYTEIGELFGREHTTIRYAVLRLKEHVHRGDPPPESAELHARAAFWQQPSKSRVMTNGR